jgi:hypothetical protein
MKKCDKREYCLRKSIEQTNRAVEWDKKHEKERKMRKNKYNKKDKIEHFRKWRKIKDGNNKME